MDTTRASLILRIRDARDTVAWGQFDRLYRPMLQRFARSRGLSPTDAEEIAQQVMVAVQSAAAWFKYDASRGRFKNWLFTSAVHRISNMRRRQRTAPLDTAVRDDLPDPNDSPAEEFEKAWQIDHLRYVLEQLRTEYPSESLEAFRRYALSEEPVETVCDAFGLTPAQLYKLKWRVARSIRLRLIDILGDSEDLPTSG